MRRRAATDAAPEVEVQGAERFEAALAAWRSGATPDDVAAEFGGETAGLVALAAGLRRSGKSPGTAAGTVADSGQVPTGPFGRAPRPSFQAGLEADICTAFDAVGGLRPPLSAGLVGRLNRWRAAVAGPRLRGAVAVTAVALILAVRAFVHDDVDPKRPALIPTVVAATVTATPTGTTVARAALGGEAHVAVETPGWASPIALAMVAATPSTALLP